MVRTFHHRRGFTTIELLIVLAIVALLGSLAASAVFRVRATSERTATETTLTKLASALDVHWKAVIDSARKEYDSLPANIKQNLVTLADNAVGSASAPKPHPRRDDRARLLYIKLRLKQEFPTNFQTAQNPTYPGDASSPAVPRHVFLPSQPVPGAAAEAPLPASLNRFTGKPAYVKAVNNKPLAPMFQSSALLVLALEQSRAGVSAVPLDQMVGSNFIRTEGQFRYLVDSWGKPLQFYIFPTAQSAAVTDLQGSDPQDPEGLLSATTSRWIPQMVTPTPPSKPWNLYADLVHPQISNRRLVPTIVSAGPDGEIGFMDGSLTVPGYAAINPTMILNGGPAFDNLFSFRLRQTGARGD